ncbi:MAG: lipase secretion chaperone, partial [Sphingomonadaceae bacterium]
TGSAPAPTGGAAGPAQARLAAQQQLRHDYFSAEEIRGLFGASDAYDDDALARLALSADTTLTPEQRQHQLARFDQRLPASLREDREAPVRVLKLEEAVLQARAAGAGDNDIYRLRSSALSPAAAARLADLDREQADWSRRISQYQAGRQQLTVPDGAALQQLRDTLFSPDEQKRLGAYE